MKLQHKLLLGALGGITPALLLMYKLNYDELLATASAGVIIGGGIKFSLAFVFGGAMAYFHKDETNPYKLFQFGIAAPGLLSLLITEQPKDTAGASTEKAATEITQTSSSSVGITGLFITSAFAQDQQGEPDNEVKRFSLPEEGFLKQVQHGFFNTLPENRFYVVHSSYSDMDRALAVSDSLSSIGQRAEVYWSENSVAPYRVVVGEQLNLEKARSMNNSLNRSHVQSQLVEVKP